MVKYRDMAKSILFLALFCALSAPAAPRVWDGECREEVPVAVRPGVAGLYSGVWEVTVGAPGEVESEVYDWEGRLVAGPFAAKTFAVVGVEPWSPESPVCYRLVTRTPGGEATSVLAFREIVRRDGRLLLNGRPVRLKSARPDAPVVEDAADDLRARQREALSRLKAVRANASVKGDGPDDAYWRYLCELNGVLVVEDARDVELREYGFADGKPDARFWSARHAFRTWSAEATGYFSRVVVKNLNWFTDAGGVRLFWTVLVDGEPSARGEFDLRGLAPRGETSYDMPAAALSARLGKAGSVSVRFAFVSDGETVAEDQTDLVDARAPEPLAAVRKGWFGRSVTLPAPGLEETDDELAVVAPGVRVVISKVSGLPSSVRTSSWFSSRELLTAPFTLGDLVPLDCTVSSVDETRGALSFTTRTRWIDSRGRTLATTAAWRAYGDGRLALTLRSDGKGAAGDLLRFSAGGPGSTVDWFGRGPWADGADAEGAFLGRWSLPVGEFRGGSGRGGVRALRVGGLAVRTLAAPFEARIAPDGVRGAEVGLVADGALALLLSAGDDPLTAASPEGDVDFSN